MTGLSLFITVSPRIKKCLLLYRCYQNHTYMCWMNLWDKNNFRVTLHFDICSWLFMRDVEKIWNTITREKMRKRDQKRTKYLEYQEKNKWKKKPERLWNEFGQTLTFHFWSSGLVFALLLPLILAGALKKLETHYILPAVHRLIRTSYIVP